MDIWSIVLLGLIAAAMLGVIMIYNRLVLLRNRYLNAFQQINVQLKRRHDLIPNLVETAKGYLAHEQSTLESVIRARNQAVEGLARAVDHPGEAAAMSTLAGAESQLSSALGRMNVLMEAYPELKANQNMMQLSEELTSTENKVAFSRQAYNDAVMHYNVYRQSFPPNVFATTFGHPRDAELLEFEDLAEIRQAPKVTF